MVDFKSRLALGALHAMTFQKERYPLVHFYCCTYEW